MRACPGRRFWDYFRGLKSIAFLKSACCSSNTFWVYVFDGSLALVVLRSVSGLFSSRGARVIPCVCSV